MEKTNRLARAAYGTVVAAGILALVVLLMRYGLGILLPFGAAYLLSLPVRAGAGWLRRKTGLHSRAGQVILLVLLMGAAVALLAGLGEWAVRQGSALVRSAVAGLSRPDNLLRRSMDSLDAWRDKLLPGEDGGAVPDWGNLLTSAAEKLLAKATDVLGALAGGLLVAVPDTLAGCVMFLLSLVYFCFDYAGFRHAVCSLLPPSAGEACHLWAARVRKLVGSYARSYAILFAVTFALLTVGFRILGMTYALPLGLLVAVVDLLPVFGVGTVLVPWGILALLGGDYRLGTGILILFGVIYGLRQVLEPRLLSRSTGLHPVTTLVAVWAGYRLFGLSGLLFFPALVYGGKVILSERPGREEQGAAVSQSEKTERKPGNVGCKTGRRVL